MISLALLWATTTYIAPPQAPSELITHITTNVEALDHAREVLRDYPVLLDIAWCESQFRQWKNGQVLQGEQVSTDRGFFQVNEHYHKEEALEKGFDIETAEGNIGYALLLYKQQGTKPWDASSKCWRKKPVSDG